MKNASTPSNTAVILLLNYKTDEVPISYGFMYQSAQRLKIPLDVFGRGEVFDGIETKPTGYKVPCSIEAKVKRLREHIVSLPPQAHHILYVDARDCLFLRPLSVICEEFNQIGWPMVMSGTIDSRPHVDPGWKARFRKRKNNLHYPCAGLWMGERPAVETALEKLEAVAALVKENKIPSSEPSLWSNDQHLWHTAYVEDIVPMRLDFEQRLFWTVPISPLDDMDVLKSMDETPVVLKNGAVPCIAHFPSERSAAMPFFAWTLNLVPLPQ